MTVDRRAQGGPGVGHGQTVVRVRHRAQAFLQLVTLAALRSGPSDRFRWTTATDAPNATASSTDATAASASTAGVKGTAAAATSTAETHGSDISTDSTSM